MLHQLSNLVFSNVTETSYSNIRQTAVE